MPAQLKLEKAKRGCGREELELPSSSLMTDDRISTYSTYLKGCIALLRRAPQQVGAFYSHHSIHATPCILHYSMLSAPPRSSVRDLDRMRHSCLGFPRAQSDLSGHAWLLGSLGDMQDARCCVHVFMFHCTRGWSWTTSRQKSLPKRSTSLMVLSQRAFQTTTKFRHKQIFATDTSRPRNQVWADDDSAKTCISVFGRIVLVER